VSQEKEYKQAKKKAAENLGARILPSNAEIAMELDKLADEFEGPERYERLIKMRREALKMMEKLQHFSPRLIGSVWRGTAHKGSDIDIEIFASRPSEILRQLKSLNLKILDIRKEEIPSCEGKRESIHIRLLTDLGFETEIIVREPEEKGKKRICEIYGDIIKGLNIDELRKLLKENPIKKFLPE